MNRKFWLTLARRFTPKLYAAKRLVELDDIEVQRKRAHSLMHIAPDANARLGVAFDGVTFRNLDDRAVFTMLQNVAVDPIMQRLDRMERLLIAAGPSGAQKAAEMLPAQSDLALSPLPQYVTLANLCQRYNFAPSYHNILLGETVNQVTGKLELLSGDMENFVHALVTGMTGYGKSWQLKAMAKQLVVAGDCDLAFVDYGVNTFGRMARHGLYPIADTPEMTIALFRVLVQEMHRRREAMAEYPEVEKLSQYNQVTGDTMRPIVLFCDEASVLFDKSSEIRGLARDLTGMGRKYGIGCAFGGTDMKVTTMPSETRGNCGLRMALCLAEPQLSRSIIHSTAAVNLSDKGRALMRLPGIAGLFEVQCPVVENWSDLPGEREQITLQPEQQTDRKRILDLHEQGMSKRQISQAVYGYAGGAAHGKVNEILSGTTVSDE